MHLEQTISVSNCSEQSFPSMLPVFSDKRPVYKGPSTDGPLSVCALLWTILVQFFRTLLWHFIFFRVALFSCCTFLILHYFYVALFWVVIFSCCIFFVLHLFSCSTLFMHCTISGCTFTRCNVFVLHYSPVARFTFILLHFFPVALCSCCTISKCVARSPTVI